jgi:hypothetical protein
MLTQAQKSALLKIPGFKLLQKQFAKENQSGSGKRKRMMGRGWWESVSNWFSQAGTDINQFLKDSKLVSNVAAYALPILGSMGGALLTVNPLGAAAGGIVGKSTADYIKSQGYGLRGGDARLSINLPNQRMRIPRPRKPMMGMGGLTFGYNGAITPNTTVGRGKQFGSGGPEYNSVSSEFGQIKT